MSAHSTRLSHFIVPLRQIAGIGADPAARLNSYDTRLRQFLDEFSGFLLSRSKARKNRSLSRLNSLGCAHDLGRVFSPPAAHRPGRARLCRALESPSAL
jgi:hypothetical protein